MILSIVPSLHASKYLSTSESIAIGSASGGLLLLGTKINNIPDGKQAVIRGHLPYEEKFQRWLGGSCQLGKQNFLDDKFGSAITPVVSSILLTTTNLSYPRNDKSKDVSQDLFLFVSGIITTKGLTDITKGIFTRQRPFHCILNEHTDTESEYGYSYTQQSFFSGHTSGAFFAVTFLNLRVRDVMRQQMTTAEYKSWRWVTSGALFSWATVVGLSRVHAYKHHLSDIVVGAAAGILIGEIFYNLNKSTNNTNSGTAPTMFHITIPL